jgi:hypothetical protein
MKQLTLALLLSTAPAAINANETDKCNNCDRTEQVIAQAEDERCCGLAELTLFDAYSAYEATSATISTTAQNMSVNDWNFLTALLTDTLGITPATQTDTTISFVFERGNMNLFQWFETLAALEAKLVEVKSILANNPNGDGGTATIDLSLSN